VYKRLLFYRNAGGPEANSTNQSCDYIQLYYGCGAAERCGSCGTAAAVSCVTLRCVTLWNAGKPAVTLTTESRSSTYRRMYARRHLSLNLTVISAKTRDAQTTIGQSIQRGVKKWQSPSIYSRPSDLSPWSDLDRSYKIETYLPSTPISHTATVLAGDLQFCDHVILFCLRLYYDLVTKNLISSFEQILTIVQLFH